MFGLIIIATIDFYNRMLNDNITQISPKDLSVECICISVRIEIDIQ